MIWNRPRHAQENGVVERSHGTTKKWIEPHNCKSAQQLKQRLEWASTLQRQHYPCVDGKSRIQSYPALLEGGRTYQAADEQAKWDLQRVCDFLGQGLWNRRVDKVGRISLYNRSYGVGRRFAAQQINVRFDAHSMEWVILDDRANEVARHSSKEISKEQILALEVTYRKSSAKNL